eukprot:CAMPEP_0194550184 /NCGR_PEP_ID=MMETSP0253-20130528/95584_1 /TAXON_ID=2966 /ORGANISM="Noctiluca scintillans" /LENGTH=486 /DNA_ID=CAMNT_0039397621 /DNA_START=46 /DNA_END=1506 /DNA_ORIENTATION=+
MNLSIGAGTLYWGGSYFLAGFAVSLIIVVLALCLTSGRTALQQPLRTHQIFSIYGDGLICANSTSIIPESYDLMMKMGQGATASGSLIGSSWCLSVLSVILVRSLEHRLPVCAWKPMIAFALLLSSVSIVTFGCLSFHGLDKTASLDDITMQLFALRGIMSFFNGMYLMQSLVALWSTPKVEMVAFNKSKMGVKTLGLGAGPLLSSIVASIQHTRDPLVLVAAISYLMAGLFAGILFLFLLLTPRDHQELVDAKIAMDAYQEVEHEAGHEADEADELAAEKLTLEKRNQMLVLSLIYGTERTCMVCALEAATSMILEVEFKWSSRDAGWAVGIVFLGTVPYMLFGERMKRCLRIHEIGWMLCCASSSVLACLAIFPVFTTRTTVILIADGFIFANGYLANGIIDGLAYRSCSDDSWLTTSQFLLTQSISQMALSRPLGPILARYLVEMGGREYYAVGQFLMAISGLVCCLKVVYLMIRRGAPKSLM